MLDRPDSKRSWDVIVQVNKQPEINTTITDPFLEAEYKDIFEDYLRNSDRQHWSLQSLELENNGVSLVKDGMKI
ncbi:hypothetical protein GGI42DRAFT_364451 [Trichoderma sp. SZMC 28013]